MTLKDILIAIAVAVLWGFNFVAMKVGIKEIPVVLFVALRALLSFFPWVFFFPRPPISWTLLIGIGLCIGTIKFSFIGMGIACGLCATIGGLLLQSQAFFSVLLAVLFLKEHPKMHEIVGMIISFLGILFIGFHAFGGETFSGILFVLGAALSWGVANILIKIAGTQKDPTKSFSMLSLIVWINIVPPLPLFGIACYSEEIHIGTILAQASLLSYAGALYSAIISGILGYALWAYLLKKYPTAVVTPFSMLIPVTATLFAIPIFNDPFTLEEGIGSLIVAVGLGINQFYPLMKKRKVKNNQ